MTKANVRILIILFAAAALVWVWSATAGGSAFGVPLAIVCKRRLFSAPVCAAFRWQIEMRSVAILIAASAGLFWNERRMKV